MNLNQLKPRKALNKAFLKLKANRTEIELFKTNLIRLIDDIKESESEEFHKNLVSDFLKNTYYKDSHYINTKGRNDLVIHNGSKSSDSVAVIIEAKKPGNKAEMLNTDNINTKAFQELVLYYLRERITHKNLEIKHLIACNIFEWFIFDASLFEKEFAQNKNLVKQFIDFEEGRLSGKTTDFFYKQIAEPAIEAIKHEVEFTHFNIRDYDKPLRNEDKKDDNLLIALYKLLSPEHLLKLPFANDSNSLDKTFYAELLHIIGLCETKDGSKKLIQRKKEGERNSASLIESTIIQLEKSDKISKLKKPSQFGDNYQERLFNVALELSITWINRILFLKLLEAQLLKYNRFDKLTASKGDKSFAFLNMDKVQNFDDLDNLFFSVLARKPKERIDEVKNIFANVPYLNSSLFELTELEDSCFCISQLRDAKLPLLSSTVIKNNNGQKLTGELVTIQYIFDFLNAYDFASEGSEEIQEDNKRLINASVLGLIFEKINGYKDGSFFTPGFITMYMCRETIRRAVVQKFNDAGANLTGFRNLSGLNEVYDAIGTHFNRTEANQIVNSLKICDPAVGSGHFLVSALNEIIAIKSELKILQDSDGKRLKEYDIVVENDELVVTDDDGELFAYNPKSKESQRVQETLFHEKQTIIENCLFGVDINPNSVKICRLRLWIELLKNAYYIVGTSPEMSIPELETLPNIDINIKCGNSLISRYALDADIKKALKASKWSIDSYRLAVMTYRNAQSKDEKREMEQLISRIKNDFESEVASNDKRLIKLNKTKGELFALTTQITLFERTKAETAAWNKQVKILSDTIAQLEQEIEEIKSNKIYENAFEWRFEFPEVLNDDGDFVGFDVVIGNPPYLVIENEKRNNEQINYFRNEYKVASYKIDLYHLFYERGINILRSDYILNFITPSNYLSNNGLINLRSFLLNNTSFSNLCIIEGQVFDEASVDTTITELIKSKELKQETINYFLWKNNSLEYKLDYSLPRDQIISDKNLILTQKISVVGNKKTILLKEYFYVKFGMQLRDRQIFISDVLINPSFEQITDKHKECYIGKDIKEYKMNFSNTFCFTDIIAKKGGCWDFKYHNAFPKLLVRQIGEVPLVALDTIGRYCLNSMFMIIAKDNHLPSYLSLLGILNSTYIRYYWRNNFSDEKQIFPKIKGSYLELLPIPINYKNVELDNLVLELLNLLPQNIDKIRNEIDQLVYQLYGLSEEEIKIVEGKG